MVVDERKLVELMKFSLFPTFAPYMSGWWKWDPIEVTNVTLKPRETYELVPTGEKGWFYGFWVTGNSPDIRIMLTVDTRKLDTTIRTAYTGGLTQALPGVQWVSAYDTVNNIYSMNFVPFSWPGIPFADYIHGVVENAGSTELTIITMGAIIVKLKERYEKKLEELLAEEVEIL